VVVSCAASYSLLVYNLTYSSLLLYNILSLQWTSHFFTCYSCLVQLLQGLKKLACAEFVVCLFSPHKNIILLLTVEKRYSSPVTGLEWLSGFQEVKVPRFHDIGRGWW
jgi:hypothetical protein